MKNINSFAFSFILSLSYSSHTTRSFFYVFRAFLFLWPLSSLKKTLLMLFLLDHWTMDSLCCQGFISWWLTMLRCWGMCRVGVSFVWFFYWLLTLLLVMRAPLRLLFLLSSFPLCFHWLFLWVFLPYCLYWPTGLPDALVRWLWLYFVCVTRKVLWTLLHNERQKNCLSVLVHSQTIYTQNMSANIKLCRFIMCNIDLAFSPKLIVEPFRLVLW